MSESHAAQGGRVEAAERVKWIALDSRPVQGLVYKTQIEVRVVTYQDGALAAMLAHGLANLAEHALQRVALVDRRP